MTTPKRTLPRTRAVLALRAPQYDPLAKKELRAAERLYQAVVKRRDLRRTKTTGDGRWIDLETEMYAAADALDSLTRPTRRTP